MKKYKLLKDFLHLKVGTAVDIFTKEIEWTIKVKKYVISIKDHLIAEIADSLGFHFDKLFEEIIEPKSIFNLKEWDMYYLICQDAYIDYLTFADDIYDKKYLTNWNAFLTKQEAEKEVKKRKAIFNIKKYCWENNIEYKENVSDEIFKYEISYSSCDNKINFTHGKFSKYFWYFFLKEEKDVERVINNCESDLKTIFEVE